MPTKEEIIWKHKKVGELYTKEVSLKVEGVVDEKYVKDYISKKGNIKAISLGIGGGRELNWLDKLKNVKEIVELAMGLIEEVFVEQMNTVS